MARNSHSAAAMVRRTMGVAKVVSTVVVGAMLACGGGKPAGSAEGKAAALPEALTCDGALPPGDLLTADAPVEPARHASQALSDAGVEGTRLYKSRKWEAAVPLLRNAASGRAGDDRANRDLCQFRLGVALLFLGQDGEAKALLGVIARDPAHAARGEMLLWLGDATAAHPGLAHYFGAFDDADVAAAKANEALTSKLNYLIGRQRFERRTYADAMFFFSRVKPRSGYSAYARRCVAKIDANTNAARGQPQAAR